MQPEDVVHLLREALRTGLLLGSPVLIVGMLVGLMVSLLQALTQVQDQTVAFVPKIVAMVLALAVVLPWLVTQMTAYTQELIRQIPQVVLGG